VLLADSSGTDQPGTTRGSSSAVAPAAEVRDRRCVGLSPIQSEPLGEMYGDGVAVALVDRRAQVGSHGQLVGAVS